MNDTIIVSCIIILLYSVFEFTGKLNVLSNKIKSIKGED